MFRLTHLWIANIAFRETTVAAQVVPPILDRCPFVTSLALSESAFLSLINAPWDDAHPNKVNMDVTIHNNLNPVEHNAFFQVTDAPHPFFNRITHLYLVNIRFPAELENTKMTNFTRLTHFALRYTSTSSDNVPKFLSCLNSVTTLQVIVVVFLRETSESDYFRAGLERCVSEIRNRDPRLYLSDSSDVFAAWKEQAVGGKSVWEKAVEYTAGLTAGL
jgi:hypothetical protein